MKRTAANLTMGKFFPLSPEHFFRVTGTAAANFAAIWKKPPFFQVFCGCEDFFIRVARPLLDNSCELI
jgi:hypothetical protein